MKLYTKYGCDFCFVLFCFASLLLFLGVFLPVIYRRGVRYSRCPSLWLLPLSLFDLIAIPLSPLLHFIPLSLSLLCLPIWAVLHHLYMYMVAFLALRILYVVALVCFCFCSLVFSPSESLPGKDVLCRLLPRPLPSVCFLFFSFPTVFASNLFWCNFLYLVTTAGFVADQLIM